MFVYHNGVILMTGIRTLEMPFSEMSEELKGGLSWTQNECPQQSKQQVKTQKKRKKNQTTKTKTKPEKTPTKTKNTTPSLKKTVKVCGPQGWRWEVPLGGGRTEREMTGRRKARSPKS